MKDIKIYEDEFIEAYKKDEEKEHFIKLFDKKGSEILKPEKENNVWIRDLKLHINCFFREALKLNTISFLFGTGSSIPLGAESIASIPESIISCIEKAKLKETHDALLLSYNTRGNSKSIPTAESTSETEKNNQIVDLETYLSDLFRLLNVYRRYSTNKVGTQIFKEQKDTDVLHYSKIESLIETIKKALFNLCKVPNVEKIEIDYYKDDPLKVHREFVKKILARPLNLKRVNLFTLNYDLAFEKAMDELGVLYLDGFVGNINRVFRPEVYNYDYYFPATTTEGKVHRLDKVIHLYKLHGSLNWIDTMSSAQNIYGIIQAKDDGEYNNAILIYPQPMKEEETLGFPYSEIFRRFSSVIQQPQNVLIVYGYGFGDEHVNRVIYNALSISTFQLIIVSWSWTDKMKEFYEKVKEDSRVSFMIGKYLGDWYNFVFNLLPDIKKMKIDEKIVETMKKLKGESIENMKEEENTNGK